MVQLSKGTCDVSSIHWLTFWHSSNACQSICSFIAHNTNMTQMYTLLTSSRDQISACVWIQPQLSTSCSMNHWVCKQVRSFATQTKVMPVTWNMFIFILPVVTANTLLDSSMFMAGVCWCYINRPGMISSYSYFLMCQLSDIFRISSLIILKSSSIPCGVGYPAPP